MLSTDRKFRLKDNINVSFIDQNSFYDDLTDNINKFMNGKQNNENADDNDIKDDIDQGSELKNLKIKNLPTLQLVFNDKDNDHNQQVLNHIVSRYQNDQGNSPSILSNKICKQLKDDCKKPQRTLSNHNNDRSNNKTSKKVREDRVIILKQIQMNLAGDDDQDELKLAHEGKVTIKHHGRKQDEIISLTEIKEIKNKINITNDDIDKIYKFYGSKEQSSISLYSLFGIAKPDLKITADVSKCDEELVKKMSILGG